jgi:hypothetical protein
MAMTAPRWLAPIEGPKKMQVHGKRRHGAGNAIDI